MPRVLLQALLHGTEAPLLCRKMASRKLRWQLLRQQPLPFAILDKVGQKAFAEQHGARVAQELWRGGRGEVGAWLQSGAPESFCLKPTHGYQNRNAFVVDDAKELLRQQPWDAVDAAQQIEADGTFEEYVAEELVRCEHGGTLPTDYKFWCFGGHVAHCTIMTGRLRSADTGSYGYGVTYADCDEHYAEAPTWCAATADAETGSTRVALPPRPACWREMVDVVRALGAATGVFTRVDMYATTSGPIFGEFQLIFDLRDWNGACDEAIRQHWRGLDGADG